MDTNSDGTSFEPPRLQPSLPPTPASPPFGPPTAAAPGPLFIPRDDVAHAAVVPTNSSPKRSKGKVVGGMVAVVALLGAGGFAVSRIVSGNGGGAASPTDVGTRLIDALAAEDVLGVVDLLLPGERDTMRQPLIDFVDHLKRLGVADTTTDLQKVGGFDLSFDGVQVEPTATNVDDVTDIRITATGTASLDGQKVPIGPLLIDEAFSGNRPDLGSSAHSSAIDWKLATVKRDGRWYLSAFYSIAETVRQDRDIPQNPVAAHGSATPEGAVQAMFDAVDGLDLEALIAALNPNETEALQRYAPLFIDSAQSALDKLHFDVRFSDVKLSATGSGDRRTVTIDGFSMHGSGNGTGVVMEKKNGCTVVTVGDTTTDSCAVGASIDEATKALGLDGNSDASALITTIRDAFADMKPVGITVQNVGGKWYVSPIGTGADALLAVMAALDKGELTAIIDGVKKLSQSFSPGDIFGSQGTIGSGSSSSSGGVDACYQLSDYTEFAGCITNGIDDGSIDATAVAPYFRFPECGVGESYFDGSVYTMSDEAFIAFATAAARCFQKYIDDGTISRFELPYELSKPDCLEGKNWYSVDDTAYNDRLFQCAG
ncbi:MAG: hypothetical protein QOC57_2647 [Ilumatobacteraceae bacterium]